MAASTSIATVLLLVIAFAAQAAAKVVELNAMSFGKVVAKHKKLIFVEFYSPDCYHCQQMEPVLEEVSEALAGKVTVVKVDARSSHDLNSRYGVRKTPTLMIFRDGESVKSAYEDLQGYRSAPVLVPFLQKHIGSDVTQVASAEDVDAIVEEEEFAVVGVFESASSEAAQTFAQVANERRGHVRFASVAGDDVAARSLAENFEVDEVPSVFVVKRQNHTLKYEGVLHSKEELTSFVDHYAFPLVGNFSMLTYYRYTRRKADMVFLFYDQEDTDLHALANARYAVEEVAKEHDNISFLTVEATASEGDGRKIIHTVGNTFYKLPALAARSHDKERSLAYNQVVGITADRLRDFMAQWGRQGTMKDRCLVSNEEQREGDYTPERIEAYDKFVESEKERIMMSEDEIREVDLNSYKKVIKKSWKDVLIVYTARWCLHSLHMEDNMHKILRSGELNDLSDELTIVKVDVVLTSGSELKHVDSVPAMKYISARYKDFPNWYGGSPYDPEAIVQFVRAYHSMRHVEIPGEGPSPFAKKKEDVMKEALEPTEDGAFSRDGSEL